MTNKSNWPEWLKQARTENAVVEIKPNGRVIWYGGDWHDGDWHGGVWHDGDWHGGVWHDGDWHGGVWHGGDWLGGVWHGGDWLGGDWHGGVWHDGDWHGGVWHGGDWLGGVWHGGDDNPTRCMFGIRGSGDTIKVGCRTYSISEAESLCDAGDLPDAAPSRNSDAGKLLRASVKAQIAWQRALAE